MTPTQRKVLLYGSLGLVGAGGVVVALSLRKKASTTTTGTPTGASGSGSSATGSRLTVAQRAARAGWTQYGGGAYYQAQRAVSLASLATVIGIPVATLLRDNCRTSQMVSAGTKIFTTQQDCPSTGLPTVQACANLSYIYSIADESQTLPCVKTIQWRLNQLGIRDKYGHVLAVDGHYGPLTESAVLNFQRHYGLLTVAQGETPEVFGTRSDWATLVAGHAVIYTGHSEPA